MDKIISEVAEIRASDVMKVKDDLEFEQCFVLNINKDQSDFGYFEIKVTENCERVIQFSTGPHAPATHWKQTIFLSDKNLQ